ncbi:MAG: ComEC family competence protein [Thermoflavifilum sp.]|nr:ComEC family competence protein [Thermoflavifilum sp.]
MHYPSNLRILLALIVGIFLYHFHLVQGMFVIGLGAISAIWTIIGVFIRLPAVAQLSLIPWHGSLLMCLWMCMGYLLSWIQDPTQRPNWLGKHLQADDYWIGVCQTAPIERLHYTKFLVNACMLIHRKDPPETCLGKVWCYVKKPYPHRLPQIGDTLIFFKRPAPIASPANPGMIDYAGYQAYQGIYFQVFLNNSDWKIRKPASGFIWQKILYHWKLYSKNKIYTFLQKPQSRAFAYAFVSGDRSDLDPAIVQQYAQTGTIHILAISGLHIAVIFVILAFLFDFFHVPHQIKILLTLLGIWLFVMYTGMSASASRAAFMISLLLVAHHLLKRPIVSMDTLISAAICLLCIHPAWIMDIGFQLSFLAVAGILLYYRFWNNLWKPKWMGLKKIWFMVAVSCSAQLLIIPLSIFYFHQFPLFFLLANLIAVPLSSILLILTVVLIASPWHIFSVAVAYCMEWIINALHYTTRFFQQIDWVRLDQLYISAWEMLGMFLIIFLAMAYVMQKRVEYAYGVLLTLLGMSIFSLYNAFHHIRQNVFIVYHIPQHSLMEWISGNRATCWTKDNISHEDILQASHRLLSIQHISMTCDTSRGIQMFIWNQIRFIQAFGKIQAWPYSLHFSDSAYLIIGQNAAPDIQWLRQMPIKAVILDGSNTAIHVHKWKTVCESLNLRLHPTVEKGAFILNL